MYKTVSGDTASLGSGKNINAHRLHIKSLYNHHIKVVKQPNIENVGRAAMDLKLNSDKHHENNPNTECMP